MNTIGKRAWLPIIVVFLAGSVATALVPLTVPILGAIASELHVDGASLGWIVSFPTLVCAFGALAFGVVVDRAGDVRLLYVGIALVILGDAGVILAPGLQWLYAARLFQGFGYVCLTVAAPAFIQRVTAGDMRRAAMALWAAHTPVGFAAAVYFGAQLLVAGMSWRWSFAGHAAVAVVIGAAALTLRHSPAAARVSRSAGTRRVLTSVPAYAVALGALGAAMLQVGVMVLVPTLMAERHEFSGPQSALLIVVAMIANLGGALLIVATRLRNVPGIVLPLAAVAAAVLGFTAVSGLGGGAKVDLAGVMLFAASVGTANALIWSLLPAAVPSPDAGGATAGLITQGSFLGVLIGPPTFFWIRHQRSMLVAALAVVLMLVMLIPLIAHARAVRSAAGNVLRTADSH